MSDIAGPETPLLIETPMGVMSYDDLKKKLSGDTEGPAWGSRRGFYETSKKLRQRHKMVLQLHCCGWTPTEIAKQLRYTPQRVGAIINSKRPDVLQFIADFEKQVAERTLDVNAKLHIAAPQAADVLVGLLTSKDENVRRNSAKDILDRAGYSPIKKVYNQNVNIPIERLESILPALQEANEVVARRGEWEVKTLPVQTGQPARKSA